MAMEKRIEEFRRKTYEQIFVSPDVDMWKVCGELCCFSVMTSDGQDVWALYMEDLMVVL